QHRLPRSPVSSIVFSLLAAVFVVGQGATMPGGRIDIDISDAGAQNALNFAVVQHNKGTNDLFLSQVAEVVKVQSQVVAGTLYTITVKMGKTSCRKGSANEVCPVHEDPELARPYQCTFTVWSRPWLNEISLQKEICQS
uniref:Zgc:163030 n=1 Tax=Lates calcarifer TaxID=8187 RepID=A0A4W6C0T0_LATCA